MSTGSASTALIPVVDEINKQLIVSDRVAFNLSDDQFTKVLAVFQPPPPTKPLLWSTKDFARQLIKVSAYLETVQYVRPSGTCFAKTLISNHFDNSMIEKFGGPDGKFETFSIDHWFSDIRGEVPKELRDWDVKGYKPMPRLPMGVDWYGALTDAELAFSGFVSLFENCIDIERETEAEITRIQHECSTAFGDHPSTAMPASAHPSAGFEKFTPSGLLNSGSGLKFAPSGNIGRGRNV